MRRTVLFVIMVLWTAQGFAAAHQRHVDIKAPDGVNIRGTYYDAAKPGPGILLLHMCNSEREAWREAARLLATAGFHVLAIDYRGFGESGGDRFIQEVQKQAAITNEKWPGDVDAAIAFLVTQPGVNKSLLGAAGGSCGVNQAIQAARRHPEVRSLVLLAGGTDLQGQQYLLQNRWLPILAAAAADDFYSVDAVGNMRWFIDVAGNPRNSLVSYPTGGHGTLMFGEHPELMIRIVDWFRDTLVKSPADPQAKVTYIETPVTRFWQALSTPGGVAKAVEIYREAKQDSPSTSLFSEVQLNQTGYFVLQQGHTQDAIELFRLNTLEHPNSANVWDSLGDAYVAAGDREKGAEMALKAISLLDARKDHPQGNDDLIRQSAEAKLK